jgi:hypothetical protein
MTAAVLLILGLLQGQTAAQPAAVSAEDLAVIDAALDHKTRNAINSARPRAIVLMFDRTMELCPTEQGSANCLGYGKRTTGIIQRQIPEITEAHVDALFARNAVAQSLPSAPAKDVILVAREKLAALMEQYGANVHAFTSLPAYFEDGTALLFLGYFCGGLCGEGNFILLRREHDGWKVVKAAMTWIS